MKSYYINTNGPKIVLLIVTTITYTNMVVELLVSRLYQRHSESS